MVEEFKAFCKKHQLIDPDSSTLVALSGGLDSVALCKIFSLANWPFALAHCNFKLRGEESDEDERFCQSLASEYKVPFFSIRFETEQIATNQKQSIQVTARNLRYEWLEQVRSENQFAKIATAHHNNDRIETFLYNFTKGAGIRGLRSIPEKNGKIIRPLLFSTKENLLAFAKMHHLKHREDKSNASTKYNRNKLRLEAIPVLKKINPNLEKTALRNFDHLKDLEQIYLWAIDQWKAQILEETANGFKINLSKLIASPAPTSILYELVEPFGFHSEQIQNILSEHKINSGAQFFSKSHRLLINRDDLLIEASKNAPLLLFEIHQNQSTLKTDDLQFLFQWNTPPPSLFPSQKNIVLIDQNKLQFPLILRRWQAGDSFCPIGMNGKRQKLKDFFINAKLSRFEKEQTWLLVSGNDICWIAGHRMDERFKITASTLSVLRITVSL